MKHGIMKSFGWIAVSLTGLMAFASNAFATPSIQDLWDAVDISTVTTQVLTLLTAMVAIRLAFLVYKYVKRTMGSA